MAQKKYLSKDDALIRMQHYCAYQERCHKEVRSKLLDLGIYGHELEDIIVNLIGGNFLNEERFACSFARGKFRLKKWGRSRILRELKMRDISSYCMRKAMNEIEEEEYLKTLQSVLKKRANLLQEKNDFARKSKLAQYAIGRGFETELVWEVIRSMDL